MPRQIKDSHKMNQVSLQYECFMCYYRLNFQLKYENLVHINNLTLSFENIHD